MVLFCLSKNRCLGELNISVVNCNTIALRMKCLNTDIGPDDESELDCRILSEFKSRAI